ncbi:MAG: outer membrane protein assembly factor BamD [Paracoccaceae bacterium]
MRGVNPRPDQGVGQLGGFALSGSFRKLCLCLGLLLAACAPKPEDTGFEGFSAEQIYRLAQGELDSGNPGKAATYFEDVERLYPYSQWSKRAVMMSAFAFHEAADYESSRAAAQRYIDFYPADEDAAYAQYLIALSYYDQIVDVGRDQGNTFLALQELRKTIQRYPDSEYSRSAALKFDLTLSHLAGKEMEIGRYYLKRGYYAAAINRFRVVVEDYQTTVHTAEALHRLVESYLSLGLVGEAQTAGAILGHNFLGSEWYEDSYDLLARNGVGPADAGKGWLSRIYRQVLRGKWI